MKPILTLCMTAALVLSLAGLVQAEGNDAARCGLDNPQCLQSGDNADQAKPAARLQSPARTTRKAELNSDVASTRNEGGVVTPRNWPLPTHNPMAMSDGTINFGPMGNENPSSAEPEAANQQEQAESSQNQHGSFAPPLPTHNPMAMSDGTISFAPGGDDPVGENMGNEPAEGADSAGQAANPQHSFSPPLPSRNPAELDHNGHAASMVGGGFDDPTGERNGDAASEPDFGGPVGRPALTPLPNRNPGDIGMGVQSSKVGGGFSDPTSDDDSPADRGSRGGKSNERTKGMRPVGFCAWGGAHCK